MMSCIFAKPYVKVDKNTNKAVWVESTNGKYIKDATKSDIEKAIAEDERSLEHLKANYDKLPKVLQEQADKQYPHRIEMLKKSLDRN